MPVSLIEAQGAGLPCFISDQISPEVDLGMNLVEFVSLNEKSLWADMLERLALSDTSRRSFREPFTAKGYDITATALEIEAFYLTVAG